MLVLALVVGCGGDEEPRAASTPAETQPAVKVEFPPGEDKTIRALRSEVPEGAVFAPAVSTFKKGKNRVGFALFDTARKQVKPEAVALYVAQPDGRRLRGPFEARRESLAVKTQFQSRQTQADLDDIDTFWVADVDFPRNGRFVVTALASVKGKMVSTSQSRSCSHSPRRSSARPACAGPWSTSPWRSPRRPRA
jgi:hypothetical protein